MRFTALLPPPPTPITSMRADWLGTIPLVPLLEAGIRPSGAISMEGPMPCMLGSIMSLIGPIRTSCVCTFALFFPDRNALSPFAGLLVAAGGGWLRGLGPGFTWQAQLGLLGVAQVNRLHFEPLQPLG